MPKDMETGRSRGIAYVEFDNVDSAKSAVESSNSTTGAGEGIELEGRILRLDFAEVKSRDTFGSRDSSNARGGFSSGRGGGRGGFGGRSGGRDGESFLFKIN